MRNRSTYIALAIYALMLAGAVLAFLWIRHQGAALVAPAPSGPQFGVAAAAPGQVDVIPHLLLALAVILIAARAVGAVSSPRSG